MTISVLQAAQAFADNVTLTVTAGSTLWVVGGSDVAGTPGITCSDTLNGSYGAALTPGAVTDATNDIGLIAFRKAGAAGGSTTVTCAGSAVILVLEIADVHATGLEDSDGQQQTTPAATADAVTTPSMTAGNQPALVVGCSLNCGFTAAPTAGTSFTSHGAIWDPGSGAIARAESRRVTSTGGFAATFTRAANANHVTVGAIFREAAAATVTASPLNTNRRRRGFPRRGPLPGVARLGTGILVGVAQSGVTGSADAALSSFAVSASGLVTFTGSGSAAVQPFAATSAGLVATTEYLAQPQPRTFGYPGLPARRPAPPRPQLGRGILVPGAVRYEGAGSAAASSFAASGSGLETFSGSATVAVSPFAVAASGLVTFTGSGSAAASPFAAAASGSETFAGSGSAAGSPFAASASGAEAFAGSGSAAAQPFAADGSGVAGDALSGSGSAAVAPFAASASGLETFTGSGSAAASPFACSGTGTESFSGTCSAAMAPFAASSSGVAGDALSGSASCAMSPFAASASGTETFSGSGSAAAQPFACSAAGAEAYTGTGSAALSPFACSGNGAQGTVFTGSGSAAAAPFAASGSGAESFAGSGAAACSPFAASGSGSETFSGSCSAALLPFACDGSGLHLLPITGSGGAAASPFGASGSGIFAAPVTGSGGAAMAAFACTGVAVYNVPQGPFEPSGPFAIWGFCVTSAEFEEEE